MAYVPGFRYDVFVSYATSDDDGRLAQFVEDIRKYLSAEFGKLFPNESVFFDRNDLNRTPTEWKRNLEQSAGSAAILLPILGPGYATSDYCASEWEWFCEGHPLRWPVGTETVYRVCPIAWRPLDEEMRGQIAPEIRAAQEQRSFSIEELGRKIANGLRLMRRSRQTVFVGECENGVRQNDKTARVWAVLLNCCASQEEADRLASLAEAVSGNEVSDAGSLKPISPDDRRAALERLVRSSGTGPAPELSVEWIIRRFAGGK